MTQHDLSEATTVLRALLGVLAQTARGNTGATGAGLAYAISVLDQDVNVAVGSANLGAPLSACFAAAVAAGATLTSMLAVYTAALSLAPAGAPARAITAYCSAEASIAAGRILAATTFTSRDDVEAALTQIGTMFDTVESASGNALLTDLYQGLVTLHATVTADLTTRSYPLPRVVTYATGTVRSALALAQLLYGDAARAGELAAENQTFNPAFMQVSGRALAA